MKRLLLLALLAALPAAGCASKPLQAEDHWNARSISPRMGRVLTGYSTDQHGTYLDYQWEQKRQARLMFQRHFLNWNPENPFQQEDPSLYAPRPVNSPVPHFQHYFFPYMLDHSILGTFSPGGGDEFFNGLATTARPLGEVSTAVVRPVNEVLTSFVDESKSGPSKEFSDLNPNVPIGKR